MFQFTEFDILMMQRALSLAWLGRYNTSPNPRVGCVITKDKQIIAEGYHRKSGQAHAEIEAIKAAQQDLTGSTVYVTLEPCSHFGKTPPCAQALIKHGVKKVIAAMQDPNPLVAGNGFKMLTDAGIEVQFGLLEENARAINRGFLSRIERGRPYLRIKTAMSLDGKIALNNKKSQWISNEAARLDVQELRAQACAILTGITTVISDNPRLNVRAIKTERQPIRIVLDSRLQIPLNCHLVQDDNSATWIVTLSSDNAKLNTLKKFPHIKIIEAKSNSGRIDLADLMQQLALLGVGEILTECGATLNGALLDAQLVDELIIYQAPIILGHDAIDAFNIKEITELNKVVAWDIIDSSLLDNNFKYILRQNNSN